MTGVIIGGGILLVVLIGVTALIIHDLETHGSD
jgi:hypothetical protein